MMHAGIWITLGLLTAVIRMIICQEGVVGSVSDNRQIIQGCKFKYSIITITITIIIIITVLLGYVLLHSTCQLQLVYCLCIQFCCKIFLCM